jgi:hypothetical protein
MTPLSYRCPLCLKTCQALSTQQLINVVVKHTMNACDPKLCVPPSPFSWYCPKAGCERGLIEAQTEKDLERLADQHWRSHYIGMHMNPNDWQPSKADLAMFAEGGVSLK